MRQQIWEGPQFRQIESKQKKEDYKNVLVKKSKKEICDIENILSTLT